MSTNRHSKIPKVEIEPATHRSRQGNVLEINCSFPIKSKFLVITLIISCVLTVTIPDAYANHVSWVGDPFILNDGSADGGSFSTPVVIEVTDTDPNPAVRDTVTVTITSSSPPSSVVLTLQETTINSGVFQNTNLALMEGTDVFLLSDSATVTIFDPNWPTSQINDDSVIIVSDSDPVGIRPIFTETGVGTNLFAATIRFGVSSDDTTNTLEALAGDIISVVDETGGNVANGMISPNPYPSGFKGAIEAAEGATITVEYETHTDSFVVGTRPPSGRGGGGLVAPSLVVDAIASTGSSSGTGNGCRGDCTPPTLGVDEAYTRLVQSGFSYNDHPVDVELYYTHYPLIIANVGHENKAVLKIYDNSGSQNIEHIELAFGLKSGTRIDESKASISLDRTSDGGKSISVFDPENALQDIRAEIINDKCSPFINTDCLIVTIYHTFRAPLDFNVVATDVWDFDKNEWQNYYNDGINVVGESLNPPKEHVGIHNGHQIKIIETGKNAAVDENGNTWTFDKEWTMDFIPPKKIDVITSHGYDRNNNEFLAYKKVQELLAQHTLAKILFGTEIHNDPKEPTTIILNYMTRNEKKELQIAKTNEMLRAAEFSYKTFRSNYMSSD